jgi:hypothetical protein
MHLAESTATIEKSVGGLPEGEKSSLFVVLLPRGSVKDDRGSFVDVQVLPELIDWRVRTEKLIGPRAPDGVYQISASAFAFVEPRNTLGTHPDLPVSMLQAEVVLIVAFEWYAVANIDEDDICEAHQRKHQVQSMVGDHRRGFRNHEHIGEPSTIEQVHVSLASEYR